MLIFNTDVFEEMIVGTTNSWLSYSQYNSVLGSADQFAIFAYPTNVTGTVIVNIFSDDSIDGRSWVLGTAAVLTGTCTSTPSGPFFGQRAEIFGTTLLASYSRLRIVLSGAGAPQCRLKVSVTGRSI